MRARAAAALRAALVGLALAVSGWATAIAAPAAPLGMYIGPGCNGAARFAAFEQWLGRRPERGSDFLSDVSWFELTKAAQRSAGCWKPTGLPMTFSVPMLPKDKVSTLAMGANGDFDVHFKRVAEILVSQGYGDAVIRIGWEFNHNWFTWRAAQDPVAWVAYWRRIVTAMRAVPGAKFQFDWCPGWSTGEIAPTEVYPGDAYVDIIGMDLYNTSWNPRTPEQRWQLKLDGPHGLKWHKAFAAQRGKPMSYPEWGTGLRPDGRGGGDDPYFITRMAEWIGTARMGYHNYWDYKAPDFDAILSDGSKPRAEAEFLKQFGGPR